MVGFMDASAHLQFYTLRTDPLTTQCCLTLAYHHHHLRTVPFHLMEWRRLRVFLEFVAFLVFGLWPFSFIIYFIF